MRWDRGHRSPNVDDRRGQGGGGGGMGPGGMLMLARLLPRLGFKGILLLLVGFAVYAFLTRGGGLTGGAPVSTPVAQQQGQLDDAASFVSFVLDDTQNTWSTVFSQRGDTYRTAELVLFTDGTQSGCGYGVAAVGPFYCPADQKVYIDLSFYEDLARRYGAPGDFAQAYVIAHEIGHHVQHQRGQLGGEGNAASVRQELQADCYAGVWARSAAQRGLLEPGDMEEGIGAAAAVGDDRLQEQANGRVRPETFTHGSAAQRMEWFRRGYAEGRPEACNTAAGTQ